MEETQCQQSNYGNNVERWVASKTETSCSQTNCTGAIQSSKSHAGKVWNSLYVKLQPSCVDFTKFGTTDDTSTTVRELAEFGPLSASRIHGTSADAHQQTQRLLLAARTTKSWRDFASYARNGMSSEDIFMSMQRKTLNSRKKFVSKQLTMSVLWP